MIIESDSVLAAPKPHRTGADVFTLVAEHLKTTSPLLRFSSPQLLQQRISSFVVANTSEDHQHPQPNPEQPSYFLPREKSPHVAEHSALPFLGEQPSVHEGAHPAFLNYDQQGRLKVDGMGIYRNMSRGQSLEGLASAVSTTNPAMIKLPKARSYTELSDSFESLPKNSWIFPFIIACCPPLLLQQFNYLPKLIAEEGKGVAIEQPIRTRPRVASDTDVGALTAGILKGHGHHSSYYLHQDSDHTSHPPFTHPSNKDGPDMYTQQPSPALPFPPSWRSLGRLFLSRDPSWSPWEPKIVYLLDNYLLEATVDGSKVIGFAQLAGAVIRRSPFTDPHHRTRVNTTIGVSSLSRGILGHSTPSRGQQHLSTPFGGGSHFMANKEEVSIALQISCLSTSDGFGARSTFWLTVTHLQDLEILESALMRASRLKVEDVFDLNVVEAQLLGRGKLLYYTCCSPLTLTVTVTIGRFNEVRLAQRKNYRIVDRKVLQRMSLEPSSSLLPFPPPNTTTAATLSDQRRPVFGNEQEDSSESFQLLNLGSNSNDNSQDDLQQMATINNKKGGSSSSSGKKKKGDKKERQYLDEEMVFGDFDLDDDNNNDPSTQTDNLDTTNINQRNSNSNNSSFHEEEQVFSSHSSDPNDHPTDSSSGRKCALKLISKEVFWERVESGKERGDALVREVLAQLILECHQLLGYNVMNLPFALSNAITSSSYSHSLPFVRIFSIFESQTGFALELELMESMDLFDLLAANGPLSEWQVRGIIAQLVDAVSFCNRLGIAHRDIKLSNITFPKKAQAVVATTANGGEEEVPLASMHNHQSGIASEEEEALTPQAASSLLPLPMLTQQQSPRPKEEHLIVKLADFGMAGFVGVDKKLRGRCGTPGYVAPDILHAGVNEPYGLNVDMFSIGVVAYTLLCGYEPFYGQDNQDLLRANRMVEYEFHSPEWDNISEQAKDWIRKALHPHADHRINPEDSKRHVWLTEFFPSQTRPSSNSSSHQTQTTSSSVRYYPSALHPHLSSTTAAPISGIAGAELPWATSHNNHSRVNVPQSYHPHPFGNGDSESAQCILC